MNVFPCMCVYVYVCVYHVLSDFPTRLGGICSPPIPSAIQKPHLTTAHVPQCSQSAACAVRRAWPALRAVDRPVTVSYLKRLHQGAAVITQLCEHHVPPSEWRSLLSEVFFNIFQNRNRIFGSVHKEQSRIHWKQMRIGTCT